MDIEKLKALKTAVEIGSITQAAEHMGYSQPGLTGMLKRLEQEIGYPLLRRGTKGVRLTEAGEAVMPYIDRVLESSRALERALADHAPARERILRIGSYTSITRGILPRSMKRFRQLYPDVQFTIRDGSCMDIEQWLVDGKIDIGLLSCCFTAPLDFVPLLNDPLYAVLPPEEDVGETVPVSYFEGRDFLIPSTGADLESLRVLERGGVHPRFSCLAMEDSAVIKMVEQGMGCSILSELVLRGNTDHVSLAPLDPPAWRQLGAGVKSLKAIGRVTKNFLNYIQNGKAQKRPRRSFRRGRFIYACSRLRSQRLGSPAHGITAATRPTTCVACTGAVSGALFASPCVCRTVPSPVCCICTIR